MANYDDWKQKYSTLNDEQKQKRNETISGMDANSEARQFTERYNQEMNNNQQSNNNGSNFNNGNGTNGQNTQNFETPTINKSETQNNNNNNQTYNYDPNEKLDTSMFGASNGKVVVKEGTAQQTGMPDYQLDSDARMNEIVSNLNAYWQNNREFFQDRATYNKMFHYDERDDQQKALLDSYWKKKEDESVATKYNTADGIKNGMNDADITPDQLNYIKNYSPEAYLEWQKKQLDDINLRIANLATPADPTDNAELFSSLSKKLNLEPGDPYQIYDNWYNMAERLGVFSDSEKLKSYQNQLDANHSKMESIMARYANNTGGTTSDALAAARMSKALAPYQQRESDLQNAYTTLLNGRNSNLAIANQSAQALAMQAQEDQRIFNQRLQGLGFAMQTANYRTPEQQAQLQLQTAQIQNDLNLLNTARVNDLNRYNQYATAKMQSQLQQELTDLSVEDKTQLKANLNNALSDYYKNYGDIIQRSQAQAVDDIIAYAKKNGISVAQALTENFIKPLQNKPEYKQKIASDYGMLAKQSIATINGKSVIMTTNPNGTISYQYIDDLDAQSAAKPYTQVDSKVMTAAPADYGYNTLGTFLMDKKTDGTQSGGQCGHFVNDYLEWIGVGRYYDDELSTKLNSVNTTLATEGAIAVFDYNHKSSDGINHGHVGIVTKVYDDGSFDMVDSNGNLNKPGKIETKHVSASSASLRGFFDPSQPPKATSTDPDRETSFEWGGNNYDFTKYSGWRDLTDDEWLTVESLLTYQTDPSTLPKSGAANGASNSRVRAAAAAIGREFGYNERQYALVKNAEKVWDDKALKGDISRNATSVSILKNLADSFGELNNGNIQSVNKWINAIKTEYGDDVTLTVASNMKVAAEEIAGALKGGASPSQEDTNRILELFNGNLSNAQAKAIFAAFAKDLLDKNMTEAMKFEQTTGYKPKSIYSDEVSDWVYNDLGLTDLGKYYDYTPAGTTGPVDIRETYFSGMYDSSDIDPNINFILNG